MKTARRPFLTGKRVFLQPVERGDIPCIAGWLNDPLVTRTMFYGQLPANLDQVEQMILGQLSTPGNAVFLVVHRKSKKSIGLAGLYELHPTAHKASFRILIGETTFWGKGYGTEITELLILYGFERLNLHRLSLGVTQENAGAVRCYEKAGFVREGVLRDDLYRNGRYYDSILMSILRTEYEAHLAAKLKRRYLQS